MSDPGNQQAAGHMGREPGDVLRSYHAAFSDSLPQEQRAETTCLQAGVKEEWLDTCTFDVAVVGERGARVARRAEPTVVNDNIER